MNKSVFEKLLFEKLKVSIKDPLVFSEFYQMLEFF
jgi:hypothetical protein